MITVRFILFPQFQMLAYVLATETLRVANKCAGQAVFCWDTLCSTNARVIASNGAEVDPDTTNWQKGPKPELVLLCAGYDPLDHVMPRTRAYLARMDRAGVTLGGVDTGSMILAHLGLLNGYGAVLHHEAEASFREHWPDIAISDNIYKLDGTRLTAAGGTATGDAMLAWIGAMTNLGLAQAVSDGMAHGSIRPGTAPQRSPPTADPLLIAMNKLMRANLSSPLSLVHVAISLRVSMKQLRRRCSLTYGITPSAYYLALRLDQAFDLLGGTHLSIAAVSAATGFASATAFARAFKARFHRTPRKVRNAAQAQRPLRNR